MQTSQPNSDEIDLLHLLANLTRFLVKNWQRIVLSIGSCVAISWIYCLYTPKVYASAMTVQSRFLPESYASQVIMGLQKQIVEDADSVVASKLNLTPSEASLIEKISVTSPFKEKISMPEEDRIVFQFSVETLDPSILPKLQSGLIFFFENLEYVKLRVTEKKKNYQNVIARIEHEISRVDSFPRAIESGSLMPSTSNSVIFDPSTMSVFMTKERNNALENLALTLGGIEVIQGFTPSKIPIRPKFSFIIAYGFSSGILLAIILLGFKSVKQLLKKYPV